MRKFFPVLISSFFMFTLLAYGKTATETLPWIWIKVGSVSMQVQIPETEDQLATGLMFRKSLPENSGMLFVFKKPGRADFWMKNTLIPLDIGFFDQKGILLEIRTMLPNSEEITSSTSKDILYALEVPEGFFKEHKLKPGISISFEME